MSPLDPMPDGFGEPGTDEWRAGIYPGNPIVWWDGNGSWGHTHHCNSWNCAECWRLGLRNDPRPEWPSPVGAA